MNIEKVVKQIQQEMNLDWVSPELQKHIGQDYMTEYLGLVIDEYKHKEQQARLDYQQQQYKESNNAEFNYYCPT